MLRDTDRKRSEDLPRLDSSRTADNPVFNPEDAESSTGLPAAMAEAPADTSPAFESGRKAESELAPLPARLQQQVRFWACTTASVPWPLGDGWLAVGCLLLHGITGTYTSFVGMQAASHCLEGPAMAISLLPWMSCWGICLTHVRMQSLMNAPLDSTAAAVAAAGSTGSAAATQQHWLDTLLQAEVSPQTAKDVARIVKQNRAGFVLVLLWVTIQWAVLGYLTATAATHWASATIGWFAFIYTVVAFPTFVAKWLSLVFTPAVVFTLATEPVRQLTADVERTTADTADYDAAAVGVHNAHQTVLRLSNLALGPIFYNWTFMPVMCVVFLYLAVGPRPSLTENCDESRLPVIFADTDHFLEGGWYNTFMHPYVCVVGLSMGVYFMIMSLKPAAKVTNECQLLASAVNDLRFCEHAEHGRGVTLARPEHLIRIEGLERGIQGKNQGQGLGAIVLDHRITNTLVLGMLVQAMSAMVFINGAIVNYHA